MVFICPVFKKLSSIQIPFGVQPLFQSFKVMDIKHWNTERSEVLISNRLSHFKAKPLEIQTKWQSLCLDFQWFWTKWPPYCSKWNAIGKLNRGLL